MLVGVLMAAFTGGESQHNLRASARFFSRGYRRHYRKHYLDIWREAMTEGNGNIMAALLSELETKARSDEGVEIEINKPDGEGSGLFIKILGQDSEEYNRIKEKQDRARMREMSKRGRGALEHLYDSNKSNEMDLAISCVLGWRHSSGNPMPFQIGRDHPEETSKFFTDYPIVYDQVRVAINDRMNFTRAHVKN